jgi:hypothetical protein
MTISLIKTWGKVQRPWGWEVRADYDDGNGGILNLSFPCLESDDQNALDCKANDTISTIPVIDISQPGGGKGPITQQGTLDGNGICSIYQDTCPLWTPPDPDPKPLPIKDPGTEPLPIKGGL